MIKKCSSLVFALGFMFLTVGCEQREEKNGVSSQESQEEYPVSSHYEELKNLEWMAGEWKDEEKDIDIAYNTEWGKNRNFLIQHFTSQRGDEIQGEQIIGWDPAEKKIRSWVFDSDGGFGESTWAQDGSVWYSAMKFTLPDGRKASALHVYTKIDNDSYTFASTNRDVDGAILPDIGPFKIVRKK
jgi:hypothetical protein